MKEKYKNNEEIIDEEEDFLDDPENEEEETIGDDTEELGEDSEENKEVEKLETNNQKVMNKMKNNSQKVNSGFQTDVDIVFVIDCTGSMQPLLDNVKESALHFREGVKTALGEKNRILRKMRIKVIGYRDYFFDWQDPDHPPMQESQFFTLPDEEEEFANFVNSLEHAGGEDDPESALEALNIAFHSDWNVPNDGAKTRQIIVLFTDAPAHPLIEDMRINPEFEKERKETIDNESTHWEEHYPDNMPGVLEELQSAYADPEVFPADSTGIVRGHRLILFAPEGMYPWNEVSRWQPCVCQSMDPEEGLKELDMESVYRLIGGSM